MKNQKTHLQKGINFMTVTLPLLILSPIVINIGLKAQQKGNINSIFYFGILLAIISIICFFLGIRALLRHLFND